MSSHRPEVSCIVPAYNAARFLVEAVESVLCQSWGPIEVVIVDDGSTDETPVVVQSLGRDVRYVRQENAGPAAARNRGLAEARGSYVGFLDADDTWPAEKIARQMDAFANDPCLDYSVGLVQNYWMEELVHERHRLAGHPKLAPLPGYVTGALLAKRQAFERVGSFDPEMKHGDSAEWFLRARGLGLKERLIPEVLLFRRMHEENRSRHMAAGSRDEFLHLLKTSLDRRRA